MIAHEVMIIRRQIAHIAPHQPLRIALIHELRGKFCALCAVEQHQRRPLEPLRQLNYLHRHGFVLECFELEHVAQGEHVSVQKQRPALVVAQVRHEVARKGEVRQAPALDRQLIDQ